MKQENLWLQITRRAVLFGFILCAACTAARAQAASLRPLVCFDAQPETLTRTLASADATNVSLTQGVPQGFYRMVINPGGANQETLPVGTNGTSNTLLVTTGLQNVLHGQLLQAHAAGETVVLTADGV